MFNSISYISHRVNSLNALSSLSQDTGAEIDVRENGKDIVVTHDPFTMHDQNICLLDNYLAHFKSNGILIVNLKCEGIEKRCIELLAKHNIKNWFFLDMSMPFLVKFSILAENKSLENFSSENLAVRFSEYEPLEYALSFSKRCSWIWVDCFNTLPLRKNNYQVLKNNHFKICLVSPELQGHSLDQIDNFKKILKAENLQIDAICTKRIDLWKS